MEKVLYQCTGNFLRPLIVFFFGAFFTALIVGFFAGFSSFSLNLLRYAVPAASSSAGILTLIGALSILVLAFSRKYKVLESCFVCTGPLNDYQIPFDQISSIEEKKDFLWGTQLEFVLQTQKILVAGLNDADAREINRIIKQQMTMMTGTNHNRESVSLSTSSIQVRGTQNASKTSFDTPIAPALLKQDLSSANYQVWLIEQYGINKNEVLNKYLCDDQLFDTIDAALTHAHELNLKRVTRQVYKIN